MTPVRLSPKAEQDIEDIGDDIARDHPARALVFVDALRTACLAIGRSPEGFQLQPDIGSAIRRVVHGRYLIFYTAREQRCGSSVCCTARMI